MEWTYGPVISCGLDVDIYRVDFAYFTQTGKCHLYLYNLRSVFIVEIISAQNYTFQLGQRDLDGNCFLNVMKLTCHMFMRNIASHFFYT